MKFYIAIAAALMLSSTASLAAEPNATDSNAAGAGGHKHWAACSADIQKFCADTEHRKGKMRACLTEHTADLSDGCKTSMAAHAAKSATPPN